MDELRVRVPAFAKLNLTLLVLDKRTDGFHELRTVFQTIALHDSLEIEFQRARRTRLSIESSVDIPGDNLIIRAAEAVLAELKIKAEVRFRLEKRIPMGGGLGGGSSDAAATLLALPVMMGRAVAAERLSALALELGSDVPFFLEGGTALGLGRGEELYSLPELPETPVLLACSGIHVPTGQAFADLQRQPATGLTSPIHHNRMKRFQSLVAGVVCPESSSDWMSLSENDFEAAVFSRFPQLATFRQLLMDRGGLLARLSGSGSTVFGLFRTAAVRDRAARRLTQDRSDVQWVATTLLPRNQFRRAWRRSLAPARKRLGPSAKDYGWIA